MFDAWINELQRIPVVGLQRSSLCDAAHSAARLRASLDAFDARVAAAVDALDDDGPGASVLIRNASKCSQREADRRSQRAEALQSLPSTASALAAGTITAEHADTLARAAGATSAELVEKSDLLHKATQRPADLLAADARAWTRRQLSQADLEETHARQRAARRCSVFPGDDGMTVLHAELDPISGAKISAALTAATDRLYHTDGGRDGARNLRTPTQRRADALLELLTQPDSAETSPDKNSTEKTSRSTRRTPVRNQLFVIAHADGTAEIPGVGPIPASELAKLVCNSDLFGLVFSTDGQPLWHGTKVRLADDNQWRALIARDGGCVICNAHPSKCEAHHVIHAGYPTNGPTDIDNLALVCRHEHHLIHDQGFVLQQRSDGSWELLSPNDPRAGP